MTRDRATAAMIRPVRLIAGTLAPPGDKSICHRYALLAALAEGESAFEHFAPGADCASTLACLGALGIAIDRENETVRIRGAGLGGLRPPASALDAGNSGSTMRMLAGPLAAHPFTSTLTGDRSLRARPMRRVIEPLTRMGARIEAEAGDRAPLTVHGGPLRGIDYETPVASAQVKSAVLFAGLLAEGTTQVREPVPTRDHTEIALREFGATVDAGPRHCLVRGGVPLGAVRARIPGDLSAAAFLVAAALALPGSHLVLTGVGVNPTRTAFLDWLRRHGAAIEVAPRAPSLGEPVADIVVRGGTLEGGHVGGQEIPALIDELPILAILGTRMRGGLTISDAAELRVKESDRIAALVDGLRRLGATVDERPDGLAVAETPRLRGAEIDCCGDHRIAMAFAITGLLATGETVLVDGDVVDISYPGFFRDLERVAER